MSKAYVLITELIHDRDGMDAYGAASMPSLLEHGGRVLVASERPEVIEGEWPTTRTVLVQFESVEAARAWYESEAYQAVVGLRHAASTSNAVILDGFEMRSS